MIVSPNIHEKKCCLGYQAFISIFTQIWLMFMVNVRKYTSPMDPSWVFQQGYPPWNSQRVYLWKLVAKGDLLRFAFLFGQNVYYDLPGTLNNNFLMDVWWNNHLLCNDLEASNWNNHKILVVWGARYCIFRDSASFKGVRKKVVNLSVNSLHLKESPCNATPPRKWPALLLEFACSMLGKSSKIFSQMVV